MGRCWGCCQENCGYTNCSCPCHRGEEREVKRQVAIVERPLCPECQHPLAFHREHEGDTGVRYGSSHYCDERMSYDNNDFCGCTHGAPPKPVYTFYAIASDRDLKKAKWYCTYSARKSSGWKKDFADAKVWTKASAAKAKATALGSSALLIEFTTDKVTIIDRAEELKKKAENARRREEKRQQELKLSAIAQAKADLERAQARLRKLEEK